MIWRYFAWANQTLAVFTFVGYNGFLAVSKKPYIITLIPALFMTSVCSTYICIAPEGLGLSHAGFLWRWYSVCSSCGSLVLYLDKQAENKENYQNEENKKIDRSCACIPYLCIRNSGLFVAS